MNWLILFIAGLFEVAWAIGMKLSNNFTHKGWSIFTFITLLLSMWLLSLSLKHLNVGTAYAIWTGIGVIGTTILGILIFKEPCDWLRVLFISMILIGIVGLKIISK